MSEESENQAEMLGMIDALCELYPHTNPEAIMFHAETLLEWGLVSNLKNGIRAAHVSLCGAGDTIAQDGNLYGWLPGGYPAVGGLTLHPITSEHIDQDGTDYVPCDCRACTYDGSRYEGQHRAAE